MDAFNDPKIRRIVMAAAAQVGKTEFELNVMGYIIAQNLGGSILYFHPSLEEAQKFSRQRISPLLRDTPALKGKVEDLKYRNSANTVLQKTYPGGVLTLAGSNSPNALAGTPVPYVICDERDRWAVSAGAEGDPFELALARQTTFYNAKAIEVSTPTIKGASNIEHSFYLGTQEYYCYKCPHCGDYSNIVFKDIHFDHTVKEVSGKNIYNVSNVRWACPKCGCLISEKDMRKQPKKWIAQNPDAYNRGIRSFWLNAFSSPWKRWDDIALKFLENKDDPARLKVVRNTLFGELWEERGDVGDEGEFLARREHYDAELPNGVLFLTCGIDTQDNRFEYEVVGHGYYGETWGIRRGFIMGRPDLDETWRGIEDVIQHKYAFADGKTMPISLTFIDSGGHFTQDVYAKCFERQGMRIYPIKGRGGESVPFVAPPNRVSIKDTKNITTWLYTIGVDSGKTKIMQSLNVRTPGARYCHFPINETCGYDYMYFNGLLSERLELVKSANGNKWTWVRIEGHLHNEPLDCRNYALAAFDLMHPNLEAREQEIKGTQKKEVKPLKKTRHISKKNSFLSDW